MGSDVRIIAHTDREVDVSGIDNHQMTNLNNVSAGGVVQEYFYLVSTRPVTKKFPTPPAHF